MVSSGDWRCRITGLDDVSAMYIDTIIELDIVTSHLLLLLFFFFSSRRRHTRLQGDWSSDVCSSDLTCPAHMHHGALFRRLPVEEGEARAGALEQRFCDEEPEAEPPLLSFARRPRSEEHTSELQSPCNLVCRLLLEQKKSRRSISS